MFLSLRYYGNQIIFFITWRGLCLVWAKPRGPAESKLSFELFDNRCQRALFCQIWSNWLTNLLEPMIWANWANWTVWHARCQMPAVSCRNDSLCSIQQMPSQIISFVRFLTDWHQLIHSINRYWLRGQQNWRVLICGLFDRRTPLQNF